jgi:hypothetical protein
LLNGSVCIPLMPAWHQDFFLFGDTVATKTRRITRMPEDKANMNQALLNHRAAYLIWAVTPQSDTYR